MMDVEAGRPMDQRAAELAALRAEVSRLRRLVALLPAPAPEPRVWLLTTDEAAEDAGVALATIYDWIREGYLPATKHGRAWRIADRDLRAHVGRRRGRGHRRIT